MAWELSRQAARRLAELIPGGAHTYAKGDDQYPELIAPVIERGQGAHVWDVDGNRYVEYGSGLRAVSLGHAHPEITEAAAAAVTLGTNFARPGVLELKAAEDFLSVLPGADMVKFAKNGSDVTTAAVKLARAYTGRDLVAACGGFLSTDDWYIGTTTMNGGIPKAISELTLSFGFNQIEQLRAIFDANPGQVACVIMEGEREVSPLPGFLAEVRQLCHANGALFILDEMVAGRRIAMGGAQELHDVEPDLSTFGKALANGFAISALAGRREVMEIASLENRDEYRVFLLSTTHGAETHALAAMRKTQEIYQRDGIIERLYEIGGLLKSGVEEVIASLSLGGYVEVIGREPNLVFATRDQEKRPSQGFRTLFMQELLKRGVVAPSFVVGAMHTTSDIDLTIDAAAGALTVYKQALEDGYDRFLEGRPVRPVFPPT